MDFFQYQAAAKRNTFWLYVLFAVAMLTIVVAVYAVVTLSLYLLPLLVRDMAVPTQFWAFDRFVMVSLSTVSLILMGSWYKIRQLKQGGGIAIAQMLGGRRLKASKDPLERQLRNIVEEMAIASGVPTPAVFILEQRGINAFAAGYAFHDTAIAVTRGAMEVLSRDELQGVIAHEFSHILHGDTGLKMQMMGLLHGITMISDVGILMIAGRSSVSYSGRMRGSHPVIMLSGVLFFAVGLLGMLAADMIKAAMSRQREYLADASAVQFTRNPEGIGNALKVIGGYQAGSRLQLPEMQQVSHLFFGEALKVWWKSNWWASHPPLISRIQRIDPRFRGRIAKIDEPSVRAKNQAFAISHFSPPPNAETLQQNVEQVMQSIGEPDAQHLNRAHYLMQQIPEDIHDLLSDTFVAKCMTYFLLLDSNKEISWQQMQMISTLDASQALAEVLRIRSLMPNMRAELKLPILDIVSPQLSELSAEQQCVFLDTLKKLIAANRKVSLFEYLLYQNFLYSFGFKGKKSPNTYIPIARMKAEVEILLDRVCCMNQTNKPRHMKAKALAQIFPNEKVKQGIGKSNLKDVIKALEKLNVCSFEDKKKLLQAIVYCVLSDGLVSTEELETMRLISMMLGCPMPLLYEGINPSQLLN
ncbi:M48 family metallopeptidase [Ghiorsea bivora]|uniref:M48 family metallopeptidase n=1 Tax=Ghiorsea bivora TaxID=1485545 RepID=UPI00056F7ACD|nr:M48 family metallopeptidase [Ghiorsea bivora]